MNAVTPNDISGKKSVASTSAAHDAMIEKTKLPRTLMGGTAAMRLAKTTYLPQEPAESTEAYEARLNRSTLFNAFGKTVEDLTGKVFAKPVTMKEDVPSQLKEWAENIDLTGRHVNVFAKDVLYDTLQAGVSYIFAEMPKREQNIRTVAEGKAAGIRPYLIHVKVENLLGWKTQVINGVETLTQARIMECVKENDGPWAEKEVPQVRVLEQGDWKTYRQNEKKEWVLHEEGKTNIPIVPLVAVYSKRTGFMTGSPPLENLADLNVAHWQSSSDQRNILHVARVPILFGSGFLTDEKITVGMGSMTTVSSPDAKLEYVEHSGQAIESGHKDIKELEFQMQTMGLQLLVDKPGQTATGEARDDAKENSTLAMTARSLQDAFEEAFGLMARYIGLGGDKGGSLEVNTDFGIRAGAGTDLQQLLDARNAGQISKETFWSEWQRRGVLSDSFDPKVEKDRLASEAPELDAGPGNGMDLGAGNEE